MGTVGKRRALVAALCVAAAAAPSPAGAQTLMDLLAGIRQGGGWIDVPIQAGRGTLITPILPTAGMNVAGCFRVWGGHSGLWDFDVRDTQGPGRLEKLAIPDQAVPFTHATGALSQLDLRVRWSEPRDTTLILWVGLRTPSGARDPCQPTYADTTRTPPRRPPG